MTAMPWWFYKSPEQAADRLDNFNRYEVMLAQGCRGCKHQGRAFDRDYCTQGRIPESNNFCRKFEVKP